MPSCALVNCKNRRVRGCGKTFHRFPFSKPIVLEQWIVNMNRGDWRPSKNSLLCSDHFEEYCFDRTGQTTRIRENAVPTIFDSSANIQKCTKKRKSTEEQLSFHEVKRPEIPAFKTDHSYFTSEGPQSTKHKLNAALERISSMKSKIKTKQQKTRRLHKKVSSLKNIIAATRKNNMISRNGAELLLNKFSNTPSNVMKRKLNKKVDNAASQKQTKSKGKDKKGGDGSKTSAVELNPWPEYIQTRIDLFDKLKAKYLEDLAAKEQSPIKVTLPDGKVVDGQSWKTTPYEVAKSISQGLADNSVISKVNGELWDLDRPLEADCSIQLLKFENEEAQSVFWHSSAHILGEAMERHYGGCLCYGPPIENGFYYDMFIEDRQVSSNEFSSLNQIVKSAIKEKQPFERLEMTKEDLLKMFEYNPFKQRILNERVTTPTTTVYRCGPLIDLCRGPHVRHTGKIKAFDITKNSATYWEGNCEAESLQRIYGISFPDTKQLKEWKTFQEEAAKRDHRKLGRDQELFFFHELSPGSCFFQPKGAHIYNTLVDYIKSEYRKRGFQEVISPNIYNSKLWMTSGHWQHYQDNIFKFDVEKETFALKPMNCPGHCLIFDHRPRSWRELPFRMADFGVLHRNELSGALSGLTRVRRFQQDDAHIFCVQDQIKTEIAGCFDFLKAVYSVFGFTYKLALSTRPKTFLGEIQMWDDAEKQLAESLTEAFGDNWKLNPEDGAFYGPKIDITIQDALKRSHQCATIQLDFQLPIRFNLKFSSNDGLEKRPVIVHRAILGSVERMIAILTESYGGKWPFWISPRQAMVIPVNPALNDYAVQVKEEIYDAGFCCEVDIDVGDTMNKKIRNAQLAQFNFILVVGEKEATNKTVNVRTRDNKVHGERAIADVIKRFAFLKKEKLLKSEDDF
ncbi:threonine--tRNA ligase 1, cytoplasmic-like isoform X2 [Anneissia japonica]|nr:threonine--tRNA ligase 1, cytoplasmic-like isoform X2 [Anneissia japonica]XP_033108808.1 threonine--tRNA ligase 1, cytoplasmic-like isoform X2 [Anneissia japonica]